MIHFSDPEPLRGTYNAHNDLRAGYDEWIEQNTYSHPTRYMGGVPSDKEQEVAHQYAKYKRFRKEVKIVEEYTVKRNDNTLERHFDEEPRQTYSNGRRNMTVFQKTKQAFDVLRGKKPILKTHDSTTHDETFVPVLIVDQYDPERERLAHIFNTHIEQQITILEEKQQAYQKERETWEAETNPKTSPPIPPETPFPIPLETIGTTYNGVDGINDELPTALRKCDKQEVQKAASTIKTSIADSKTLDAEPLPSIPERPVQSAMR